MTTDKIYVDASQPATLHDLGGTFAYPTLGEAKLCEAAEGIAQSVLDDLTHAGALALVGREILPSRHPNWISA